MKSYRVFAHISYRYTLRCNPIKPMIECGIPFIIHGEGAKICMGMIINDDTHQVFTGYAEVDGVYGKNYDFTNLFIAFLQEV